VAVVLVTLFLFLFFLHLGSRLLPAGELAIFAPALLGGAGLLFPLQAGDDGGAAGVAVAEVVELLGEELASDGAVLGAGSGGLGFDDDAGGDVGELDCRVGFVLNNGKRLAFFFFFFLRLLFL
jgi:hypothetical protein